MKAIVYDHYGPPDVLRLAEIEKPRPAEDQVLIKVRASSVNPYDWHFIRGTPSFIRLFTGISRPKKPRLGADVAGEIVATGSKVTNLKAGDAVFGTASGAFAEYVCASPSSLAIKPENIAWEQAASVPIAGITALQGLRDKCGDVAGKRVLINGASGGVGTFAVQIAKSLGAQVMAVCSSRNVELVRSLGADDVVDYTREELLQGDRCFDVFFDLVGNYPLQSCLRVLEPKGVYIGCGGGGPERGSMELLGSMLQGLALRPFTSRKMPGLLAKVNTADLDVLADLMRTGKVVPVVDRTHPLGEIADAIRFIERGHARGKVAITVA